MPFVPPPAREAPYKALPPHVFPLSVKLRLCLAVYLQFQLPAVILGLVGAVVLAIMHHADFLNSARSRQLVYLFPLVPIVPLGVIGMTAAIWRFVRIQIDERLNRPPA